MTQQKKTSKEVGRLQQKKTAVRKKKKLLEMMKKKRKMTGRRISPILLYKGLSDLAKENVLIIMERE